MPLISCFTNAFLRLLSYSATDFVDFGVCIALERTETLKETVGKFQFSGSNQAFMTTVIDDAVLSLGLALRDMDNVFEIAITGYALALAGDSGAQYAVTQLNEQAVELGK